MACYACVCVTNPHSSCELGLAERAGMRSARVVACIESTIFVPTSVLGRCVFPFYNNRTQAYMLVKTERLHTCYRREQHAEDVKPSFCEALWKPVHHAVIPPHAARSTQHSRAARTHRTKVRSAKDQNERTGFGSLSPASTFVLVDRAGSRWAVGGLGEFYVHPYSSVRGLDCTL